MNEHAPTLVIELARSLMTTLEENLPGWQRAFVRFEDIRRLLRVERIVCTSDGVFLIAVALVRKTKTEYSLPGRRYDKSLEWSAASLFLNLIYSFEVEVNHSQ